METIEAKVDSGIVSDIREEPTPQEAPLDDTDTRNIKESVVIVPMIGEASLHDEVLQDEGHNSDSSSEYEFNEEYAGNLDKTGRHDDKSGSFIPLPKSPIASDTFPVEDPKIVRDETQQIGAPGKEVAQESNVSTLNRQEINSYINAFLTTHLTNKWSVENYRRSISASTQRSKDHSSQIAEMQKTINDQSEKLNSLEDLVKSQAEMIHRLNLSLDASYKSYTELSETVRQQGSDSLKTADVSEWNNGEIFSLCSENVDDRTKQALIDKSIHSRLATLEEIKKIEHYNNETISSSEVNSLRMDGWQALAAYLAARGNFPRYLLNDENFTPLLKDKDEILWLLSEYDTRAAARQFNQTRRYQGGNQRDDASTSRQSQEIRPFVPRTNPPETRRADNLSRANMEPNVGSKPK